MTSYPVHLAAERPERFDRFQLLIRFAVLVVLGILQISFGTLFALAYGLLPIYAAVRASSLGPESSYFDEEGARLTMLLRWFASIGAWAWLAVDRLPSEKPEETTTLSIDDTSPRPTAASALLRIVTGLSFLLGLNRYGVRLLAYQACLVDAYPPFAWSETLRALPRSKAVV